MLGLMNWKQIKRIAIGYNLLGVKGVLALSVALFQLPFVIFAYFVIDLANAFYEKYQQDEAEDLSDEKITAIQTSTGQTQEDLDKIAREQKEFYANIMGKQKSLTLLNKLISESLVREKDLLSLTGTSGYYQLFVYSSSLTRLAKGVGIDSANRMYPTFLEELGFARLGQSAPFFIINKNNLKEEKLTDIREFKKFLNYHFSKIREREWHAFLEKVEPVNKSKYEKLRDKGYKNLGALKINYLITETNMNVTNIGFVDGDRMGLGKVTNSEKINQQILEGSKIRTTKLTKELKVRIKKVIDKQDITLLLDGVSKKERDMIDQDQDQLKEKMAVETVLDFSKISPLDLAKELKSMGLSKKKSEEVSVGIVSQAIEYKQALEELRINI